MTARARHGWLALLAALPLAAQAVVLTGEVRSQGAQDILTPPSMSSPVVLRYYREDGAQVKRGDPVLRIDAGSAAQQLQSLRDQIELARIKANKDIADLELARIDAELALVDAKAAEAAAALDAALPKELISGLRYDNYQGERERTRRERALAQTRLTEATGAVARRRQDSALEVRKLELQLGFFEAQVNAATVTAERDGTVVHGFQNGMFGNAGGRYEEGSTAFPGTEVGQVVAAGGRSGIRAWALEIDRATLKVGQAVTLRFDALPGVIGSGRIGAISGAADAKPEWGNGRYYTIDIDLPEHHDLARLLPGMSVRVDTDAARTAMRGGKSLAARKTTATGEVYAARTVALAPPEIEGLWQMNITQMAEDGSQVKRGQPVVVFAAGDLMQKLPAKRSALAEKQRAQEKLRLELADKQRDAALASAQAASEADKATRKAGQPKDYIAGIEYRKLVIDRDKTAQRKTLMAQRERIAANARVAQQRQADAEVAQLQAEVARIQQSLAKLTVAAPRDGIFLHHSTWSGEKIDTGSQVWRGVSVADIPDMASLAVRASLPERDLLRVRSGQRVRLVLGGSGRRLEGTVARIGNSVHSKSRAEPIPVVDIDIALDANARNGLKPGQPVTVEIAAGKGAGA